MLASVLIIFLATHVSANGSIVTFQELVCQHCNALHGQDEAATLRTLVGKAGRPGVPGPRGPPGQVNETALKELVRYEMKIGRKESSLDINETVLREIIKEEIEMALESFRNQSKAEMQRPSATNTATTTTATPTTTTATPTTTNGWTVFQRRMDGSVDFYRDWTDYVNGFGNENGEFWLGLEKIYQLTKSGDKKLQIDMIASNGRYFTARYSHFQIGPASDNYRIQLSGNSGNATNGFQNYQDNKQFSTKDADHDTLTGASCAQNRKGGWWFSDCYTNLNGIFGRTNFEGIRWYDGSGYTRMRYTEMKIRRRV